jgi:hypothetical protein
MKRHPSTQAGLFAFQRQRVHFQQVAVDSAYMQNGYVSGNLIEKRCAALVLLRN